MAALVTIVFMAFAWLLSSWLLMIGVGNIHNWWEFVPPMSFTEALEIMFIPSTVSFLIHYLVAQLKAAR